MPFFQTGNTTHPTFQPLPSFAASPPRNLPLRQSPGTTLLRDAHGTDGSKQHRSTLRLPVQNRRNGGQPANIPRAVPPSVLQYRENASASACMRVNSYRTERSGSDIQGRERRARNDRSNWAEAAGKNHMPPGIGKPSFSGSRSVGTHRRFLYGAPSLFKTPPVTPVKNRNTPMCRCSFRARCSLPQFGSCRLYPVQNQIHLHWRGYIPRAQILELRSRPVGDATG